MTYRGRQQCRRFVSWPLIVAALLLILNGSGVASGAAEADLGGPSAARLSGHWSQLGPPALREHSAIYDPLRVRMIVFGGRDPSSARSEVWSFSLSGPSRWVDITPTAPGPEARLNCAPIYDPIGDRLLFFGGATGSNEPLGDLWALSLTDPPRWTRLEPSGPSPAARFGHTAIYDPVRERMLVFGGTTSGGPSDEAWALNLSGSLSWTKLTPPGSGPGARSGHTAVYDPIRDRMIIVAGTSNVSDVWALQLSGAGSWSRVVDGGPFTGAHSLIYDPTADRLLAFGYPYTPRSNDILALSLSNPTGWSPISLPGIPGRQFHTAIYDPTDQRMIVFGGWDGEWFNDTWSLSLVGTLEWSRLSPGDASAPEMAEHTAIYDPRRDRMVVFSGQNTGHGDLFSLDLRGNPEWLPLVASGTPPSERRGHTAFYDPLRDRMVVFGGAHGNDTWTLAFSAPETWSELATSGTPPPGRSDHTAIYDPVRDRMIIFGGSDADGFFRDVWALTLSANPTWTELETSGGPPGGTFGPGIANHSAVYDPIGDRMIVYGGNVGTPHTILFTGDAWALTLGDHPSWTRLSTTGERPQERERHTAFYDSLRARMVVFGGASFGPYSLDDAWALDLRCEGWIRLTPTAGPPAARHDHTVVYDSANDSMVVFAGTAPNAELKDVWALAFSRARNSAPTITRTFPGSGLVGIAVTIRGEHFTCATSVTFNGMAASFTVVSDTEITTTVPIGATTGRIAVTTLDGMALSGPPFNVLAKPTITGPLFSASYYAFRTGAGTRSVMLKDLNADGRLDMVAANSSSNSASILLGNGDGRFTAQRQYDAGPDPISLAVGDLDGDQRLDLVFADLDSSEVSVLLGNGDGSFRARTAFPTARRPIAVVIGDLNGDGRPDLATADSDADSISVLLGNGDGTFQPGIDVATGAQPVSIVAYDLNSDGRLDLVSANGSGNTVSVMLGTGSGAFASRIDYPAGFGPSAVAVADVNGDGWVDLVAANLYSNNATLLFGNGHGTFSSAPDLAIGLAPVALALGDLNGDGHVDIMTANEFTNQVTVRLGTGGGDFAAASSFVTAQTPLALAFGDINGDGRVDVATANYAAGSVAVLIGNGDGSFGTQRILEAGNNPGSPAAADLDQDGRLDVVTPSFSDSTFSVLIGDGKGTLAPRKIYAAGGNPGTLTTGDLNHDGKLDFVTPLGAGHGVTVVLGRDRGNFASPAFYSTAISPISVAIGDLNEDGNQDLAVASAALSASSVSVLRGNGDGTFQPRTEVTTSGPMISVAVADFNRDGHADLAVAYGNSPLIGVLLGRGDGTFQEPVDLAVGGFPFSVRIADLNADGIPDLVVPHSSSAVAILLGQGDGTFAREPDVPSCGAGLVSIADFDADQRLDLAVCARGGGISMLLGNGDGTFDTTVPDIVFGTPGGGTATAGDLNGDGRPELIVTTDRGLFVMLNTSDSTTTVLLSLFVAEPSPHGIAVRWQLREPEGLNGVVLERSLAASGPWSVVPIEPYQENGISVALDRTVVPGRTYYYRLLVTMQGGSTQTFGPISAVAGQPITEFELSGVAPNPTNGSAHIEYAVGRTGPVRLEVLDVLGRSITTLVSGTLRPGRYETTWNGRGKGTRASSGIYFVRYRAAGKTMVRRLVVVR